MIANRFLSSPKSPDRRWSQHSFLINGYQSGTFCLR